MKGKQHFRVEVSQEVYAAYLTDDKKIEPIMAILRREPEYGNKQLKRIYI